LTSDPWLSSDIDRHLCGPTSIARSTEDSSCSSWVAPHSAMVTSVVLRISLWLDDGRASMSSVLGFLPHRVPPRQQLRELAIDARGISFGLPILSFKAMASSFPSRAGDLSGPSPCPRRRRLARVLVRRATERAAVDRRDDEAWSQERTSGRRVAALAATMPKPVSLQDQMATSVVE
jgi:hypothetical protein